MALRKAMILVGALLLVPTFQNRIKLNQENKFTLGKTEEMIKHANDRAMNKAMKRAHVTSPDSTMASTSRLNKAMKQKAKKDQEELAEASTPQDVHKDQIGKVKEDQEELAEASTSQEVHKDQIGKVEEEVHKDQIGKVEEDSADESMAAVGRPFEDEDSSIKEAVALSASAGGVELARCRRQDDTCLQAYWKWSTVPSCAKAAVATGTSHYSKSYCETYTKEMRECCAKSCVTQGLQEAAMMGCSPEAEAAVKRKQAQVPLGVTAQKKKGPASIPASPSPDAMATTNGNETPTQAKRQKQKAKNKKQGPNKRQPGRWVLFPIENEEKEQRAKTGLITREKTQAKTRKKTQAAKGKDEDSAKDKGEATVKDKEEDTGKDKGEEKGKSNGRGRAPFINAVGLLGSKITLAYRRGDFVGFIYEEDPATKTLLIRSWKAFEAFGRDAVIPLGSNSVGAKVGDAITFDLELVQEGQEKPQSVAVNILLRSSSNGGIIAYKGFSGLSTMTPLTFLRSGFFGLIYQQVHASKTLLIACWKARDEFGSEAVIPLWGNPVRARVGDTISFDVGVLVQEGKGKPRPVAINLLIRSRGDGTAVPVQAPTNVCTQVLYYLSDENLRTDTFFQGTIATTQGGWISTDILVGCRRMQQLAASSQKIINCLRNAPGVEVRDTPGQEAVRRTSPPPRLEGSFIVANVAKQSAVVPALAKKTYTKERLTLLEDLAMTETPTKMVGQDQEELDSARTPEADEYEWGQWERGQSAPAATGPEAVEHEWGQWQQGQSAPAVAEAKGPGAAIQG